MEKSKTEHLKKKQRELQEKIKLKELCKPISESISFLESNNFEYKILYKGSNLNWINESLKIRKKDGYNGIHGDFQIDVNDSFKKNITHLLSENDFLNCEEIIAFIKQVPHDTNLIICSLTSSAEIEISRDTFLTQPSSFFPTPETWVIDNKKSILIENIWTQGIIRFINIENHENPILKLKATIE